MLPETTGQREDPSQQADRFANLVALRTIEHKIDPLLFAQVISSVSSHFLNYFLVRWVTRWIYPDAWIGGVEVGL